MNNFQALSSGFRMLAREVKDHDSPEARFVVWAVEHEGEKGAIPSLRTIAQGLAPDGSVRTYEKLSSAEKWEYAHAYEVVCMKLLEHVADSEHMRMDKESSNQALRNAA